MGAGWVGPDGCPQVQLAEVVGRVPELREPRDRERADCEVSLLALHPWREALWLPLLGLETVSVFQGCLLESHYYHVNSFNLLLMIT